MEDWFNKSLEGFGFDFQDFSDQFNVVLQQADKYSVI